LTGSGFFSSGVLTGSGFFTSDAGSDFFSSSALRGTLTLISGVEICDDLVA